MTASCCFRSLIASCKATITRCDLSAKILFKFAFSCLIVLKLRLQLHGAIYRPDSFVLILRYCANLKAIRYESTSLNRVVADKSHRVVVA